ncbi:MAG: flagellar export protein FliJ [Proteobacteria bacterium]|nr:flagellar export protein FliJ [Pseudomonadota bacterium]MBU1610726.1 flagellar export protein FliJ [Pseudomonadota bacterium]
MPKPFVFKLDRVLDYRHQLEDEAVALLAQAQAAHDDQRKVVDALAATLKHHLKHGLKKEGTADDIWLWRQYKDGLEQDLSRAKAELASLALKLQKCRQDAVKRSKDRQLLDKLKDKQATRYHHEQSLKEQKENDESSALRHKTKDY